MVVMSRAQELEYLFHHIFLPPRVPQSSQEDATLAGDRALAEYVHKVAQDFRNISDSNEYQRWDRIRMTLDTFITLHRNDNALSRDAITKELRNVENGATLLLHIAMQNSALIVRKERNEYIFETFEASPSAANVLASKNALQWVCADHDVFSSVLSS